MPDDNLDPFFALIVEVGIINQISTAFLEARLPDGLLVSHFSVVNHLIRVRDGSTPLELARAFQVPKTSMSHTLAGLEKNGFVETHPNPGDKRSKQVWLTADGRQFRNEALMQLVPIFQALAERFSPERVLSILPELSDFREVLDKLRDEIK